MNFHYYYTSLFDPKEAIHSLINQIGNDTNCIQLVFFADVSSTQEYDVLLQQIKDICASSHFSVRPLCSLVSQPLLNNNSMAVEVQYYTSNTLSIKCKEHLGISYIRIEEKEHSSLIIGGLQGHGDTIRQQSDAIFNNLYEILRHEQFDIHHIIRQWNYIEKITSIHQGIQNYQAFNDSRSVFYNKTDWNDMGYPAATGIGMNCGGVMIDAIACKPHQANCQIIPLDNPLQIAAHAYSEEMLLGEKDQRLQHKSTPKFERAKLIQTTNDTICYISGTAAIRGEKSSLEHTIESQTKTTLENIEHLISISNLKNEGIVPTPQLKLSNLRVYLKNPSDYSKAKKIIDENYSSIPVLYIWSDVCREELLIEIEGVASNTIQ